MNQLCFLVRYSAAYAALIALDSLRVKGANIPLSLVKIRPAIDDPLKSSGQQCAKAGVQQN